MLHRTVNRYEDGKILTTGWVSVMFHGEISEDEINEIEALLGHFLDIHQLRNALNFGHARILCDKLHAEGKCKMRGRWNMVEHFIHYFAHTPEKACEKLADWGQVSKYLQTGFFHDGRKPSNVTIWRIKKRLISIAGIENVRI